MTVVEKEKYNCVLPDLSKEANEEVLVLFVHACHYTFTCTDLDGP